MPPRNKTTGWKGAQRSTRQPGRWHEAGHPAILIGSGTKSATA
jgi:RES domain-containing protein